MFDILASDIIVMQELKIQRKDLRDDMVMLDGWDAYFSLPKHKKGYSGVGIYTRNATCAPIRAEEGILGVLPSANGVAYCDLPADEAIGGYPDEEQIAVLGVDPAALDAEGRCVVLEFPAFVLFGVYAPANSNGLRDDFRHGFICALDCRIRNLAKNGKRVVLVGDLNVSKDELDSAGSVEDCKKANITHEDYISTPNRRIFNQLLVGGEVVGSRDEGREQGILWDTCRGFHPDRKGMYTHWEQKINARPGNYGSRIDFVLVSESMKDWVKDANIQEGLLGSDHCPVYADFDDVILDEGEEKRFVDVLNPPGVFRNGLREQEWKLSTVPGFSAKRMPEFDKRRSIKSMFMKRSESSVGESTAKEEVKPVKVSPEKDLEPTKADSSVSTTNGTSSHTSDVTGPIPSPKRKLSVATIEKPVKKQKMDGATQGLKGQQSLKGFFSAPPKALPSNGVSPVKLNDSQVQPRHNTEGGKPPEIAQQREHARTPPLSSRLGDQTSPSTPMVMPPPESSAPTSSPPTPSAESISASLAAVEASQRSWGALFAKPASPLCEGHSEPCKSMQTKKKGSNQGRSFWMCARPLGPSGEKEKGTSWRCGTFIWCSDWKPG